MARCDYLKVTPEEKYVEARKKLKAKNEDVEAGPVIGRINRKLANQVYANKRLFGDSDGDYTRICGDILDESVMREYNSIKDLEDPDH
jgi:hypothetical protein